MSIFRDFDFGYLMPNMNMQMYPYVFVLYYVFILSFFFRLILYSLVGFYNGRAICFFFLNHNTSF